MPDERPGHDFAVSSCVVREDPGLLGRPEIRLWPWPACSGAALLVFLSAPAWARVISADLRRLAAYRDRYFSPIVEEPLSLPFAEFADLVVVDRLAFDGVVGDEFDDAGVVVWAPVLQFEDLEAAPFGFARPLLGLLLVELMPGLRIVGDFEVADLLGRECCVATPHQLLCGFRLALTLDDGATAG